VINSKTSMNRTATSNGCPSNATGDPCPTKRLDPPFMGLTSMHHPHVVPSFPFQPTAGKQRLCQTAHTHHVSRCAHIDLVFEMHLVYGFERLTHFCLQFFVHFFLRPIIMHGVLHPFKVGNGYAAGI